MSAAGHLARPAAVSFDVAYPARLSRPTTLFRLVLAVPQLIIVLLLLEVLQIVSLFAWFSILLTGRYPKSLFEFSAGVLRWIANVVAYLALFRDEYPPFSWEPGAYPLTLNIELVERQSRWRLFIRTVALFPAYLFIYLVAVAWTATTLVSWIAIVITGKYPRRLFDYGVDVMRWCLRLVAFFALLRDEYPIYGVKRTTLVLGGIVGIPTTIGLLALYSVAIPMSGDHVADVSYRQALAGSPVVQDAGAYTAVQATLNTASDPADRFAGVVRASPGDRLVSFSLVIQNSGRSALDVSANDFRLKAADGHKYSPVLVLIDNLAAPVDIRAHSNSKADIVFELPQGVMPGELRYGSFFNFWSDGTDTIVFRFH